MKNSFLHIAIALLIFSMSLSAQKRAKYEDVLPGILQSEPTSAVAAIKSYLEEDPEDNVGKYFQLGLIYHQRFESSDPLKEYKKAMANIGLCKESFGMVKQYIDEREVNRNEEEYFNFGYTDGRGKLVIKYDSILTTMDRFLATQEAFEQNMPGIYESFTKSYADYSKANGGFSSIIGRYKTLKDLYLLYDSNLESEFNQLKENYQSSLKHFEEYKAKTDTFDIGYSQKLKTDRINIYRLDGLDVEVNFLQDAIPVWDYATWVDEVQEYIDTEIKALRTKMEQNEKLIANKLKRTEEDFANGSYEQLKVDKEFLFTLRKFDLRSVVEPLFLYKEWKHAILHQEHWAKTIDADHSQAFHRKMASYGRMVHNIRKADTVLQEVIKRDVAGSYEKYKSFIDEYYQGIEGIKTYANSELAISDKDFLHYVDKIQEIAREEFNEEIPETTLKYGRYVIPDYEQKDGSEENPGQLFTTSIVRNIDGSEYLGGVFFKSKENKKASFICKKEPNGRVSWFKEFLLEKDSAGADSHTEIAVLYAAQTGCVFVLNGSHIESGEKFNVILGYDEGGNRIMEHDIETTSYPRSIDFVQRTHSYMVTFKGEDRAHNFDDDSELYIDNINDRGESVWETGIRVTGNVTGVVVVEDGYVISGNYQSIENLQGQQVIAPNAEATFLVKLNKKGRMVNQLLFSKDEPYYTDIFFKTGDHAIHLFGSKNGHDRGHIEKDDNALVHFIVTRDLHLVSDSFEN